ncbi:LLM class flavin-dependent oxidoreductase [Schumannella soli]|uniref:LLM class flavin-dependent oxidoreductase n=1 Tax=Schumannella soli TaxID=2590779 RepID=A0A506Y328_9MICO|nr:LLM class flavin-dependent oxidoreductase [Schumannella soli]TPW76435.1 LLM class flavin-dependent oxidoreductase [Schumannella soli]
MAKQQHFGWFLSRGFGPHGWGKPYWDWDYDWRRPDLYQQSVRALEQAGLDLVIIEDALSAGFPETLDLRIRGAYGAPKHDPVALTPYLLNATQHLGIVPTVNVASWLPYVAARQFASLHHLSDHRVGINVVTDTGSARHLGLEPVPHDRAYDRADEWISGIRELWHSWGEGAVVADAQTGRYADASRITATQHEGEFFRFEGPLNAVPFELSDPAIVSPGGSPRGIDFAGKHSDVQLALASLDVNSIRAYAEKVRAAAAVYGRERDIRTLFVFKPQIVSSREEADRIVAASADPDEGQLREIALGWSSDSETDLTALDLDRPLDEGVFGQHVSRGTIRGLLGRFDDFAEQPLRQVLAQHARLGRVSSREGYVGTADEIADFIEELGDDGTADGFIFSGDLHPVTIHRTLDELVPILRRRGVLRRDYGQGGVVGNLRDF